ncbi:MAG: agmatine deiminase [Anaerolineales bacterium]|nr:agmatine deiminase [Anaerolineae bacterium]PWB53250.1 MAG: agmatine deiminase [Anaerolineales bacterium]
MAQVFSSTPQADGFRMPAEFSPHAGTWMLWPQRPDNWRMGGKPAQKAFVAVASAIAQFEPLTMGVNHDQFSNARQMLPANIRVVEISNNDAWMRDCGPTFLIDEKGGIRGIDWVFNAWGGLFNGLYFPWDLDEGVAPKVFEIEQVDYYRAPIVLEGGSIHVDGQGTCMTTAECLLSPGRNPDLAQEQIESHLKEYLNVEKVLWIPRGVFHDETTGHVDNIACFLQPGEIALTWTDDKSDPQYERSAEAYDYLMSNRDARGRRFEVHKLHQPDPIFITPEEADGVDAVDGSLPREAGDRMAASYVNFYFCNGAAIVPTFGDRHDKAALDALQTWMPERKIVGIPAREILLGGGNIHCITQQQPQR